MQWRRRYIDVPNSPNGSCLTVDARSEQATNGWRTRWNGRKAWLQFHLYVGLVAGAVFVLIGLTGSILAFRGEIDGWLNFEFKTVVPPTHVGAQYRLIDELYAAAIAVVPPEGTPTFVHLPSRPSVSFDLVYFMQTEHDHRDYRQIFVDPYTGAVIGERLMVSMENYFAEPFITFVMHLHSMLLMEKAGETAVGMIGLLIFGSLASGLYLWWPRNGKWRQAIAIKSNASNQRFILDLHKTTGVLASLAMVVTLFSGTYLTFGPQVRALVALFSPIDRNMLPRNLRSEPSRGRQPIGFDAATAIADRMFPDGRLVSLQPPRGADGVYIIGKHADDEVYRNETKRLIAVDQYSGKVLHIQDPRKFTAGEKFLEWQFPLHTGEAFGNIGRALVAVIGVVPALLYITGVIRWVQKRRLRKYRN